MFEFRPTSLCNVSYEIIAKSLANKLKTILDVIISHTQAIIASGRLIIDDAILRLKCIHTINNTRGWKEGQVAFTLDMSKTYDRVEWLFFRAMLNISVGFSRF